MLSDVLYLNGTWRHVLTTFDPADGMTPMDADSTPTVAVRKNGSSVGDSVTVTNIGTGLYSLAYNPSDEVAGDQFELVVSATVDGQQSNFTVKLTVPDLSGTSVVDATAVSATLATITTTLAAIATAIGGLAAAVWAYATRTLTSPAGSVPEDGEGPELLIKSGSIWQHSITGLGSLAGYDKIWITAKKSLNDPDSKAIFKIEKTDGLVVLNRLSEGLTALDASITVDDEDAGDLSFEMLPDSTVQLNGQPFVYDIKVRIPPHETVQRTAGRGTVVRCVTRET